MHSFRSLSFRLAVLQVIVAAAALAGASAVQGQAYPAKQIRFIIPYPPGGGNDILARDLARVVSESLGVPIVTDYKPGASTIIGAETAARAANDGSAMFMGNNSTFTINPNLYRKLPYDPIKDFEPVSLLATAPFFVLVNPKVPVNSVKELISLAKANPGKVNFGSAGVGIVTHLAGEMLNYDAQINMVHIPYKGASQVLTDLVGGHIQVAFNNVLSSMPLVRNGQIKPLAVTGAKRTDVMPDLPTVAEAAGLPDYESSVWYAVFVPARTPPEIIRRLNTEFVKSVKDPKVKERLSADGATLVGSSPEELNAVVKRDLAKWSKVIKEAKLQLDIPKE